MEFHGIKCDICGKEKGESNHWYVAITGAPAQPGIAFGPIDSIISDPTVKREHICGQGCLHKRLDRWIANLHAATNPSEAA